MRALRIYKDVRIPNGGSLACIRLQHAAAEQDAANEGPLHGIKVTGTLPSRPDASTGDVRHYGCNKAPSEWSKAAFFWGLQVLDVGQVVAGNFCGALLAYFGADVIKVSRAEAS